MSAAGVFKRVAEFYPPTPEAELDQDPTLRLLDGPDPDQGQLLACSDATSILPPASTQVHISAFPVLSRNHSHFKIIS